MSYMYYFLILLPLLDGSNGKKLPLFIKPCKFDNAINECIVKVFNDNREMFIRGVPALQIPSLDPMFVDKIDFNTGNGRVVSLDAVFTDVNLYGGKNVEIKRLGFDFNQQMAEIVTYIPRITIDSHYKMKGRILVVELNGEGRARGNFTDIISVHKFRGNLVRKCNKTYVDWTDQEVDLKLGSAQLYFHDLFRTKPKLTESTNQLINDNAMEIIHDLKPLIQETISSVTFSIMKNVFNLWALEDLFIYENK